MNTSKIIKNFHRRLEDLGYKGQVINAKRIPDLRNNMQTLRDQSLIPSSLYEDYKIYFEFEVKADFPEVNSLFTIAKPVPQHRAIFNWRGKKLPLIIPPTYLYNKEITNEVKVIMAEVLSPEGFNFTYARLPQKTLAVRGGLAEYGRNNISYIQGMGSFFRLTTFYTDFPVEEDNWRELKMMELCNKCSACINNCPTGAISTDRFLLHVERCLTQHNEQPGEIPFPEWIDPSWHNCLVGCLQCQNVCPANKKVKDWTEAGPVFTEEETKLLTNKQELDNLPIKLMMKLKKFEFAHYLKVFPRNIGGILKK